jgi:hypothetical protein
VVKRRHFYNIAKLNNLGHATNHEANALHSTVLLLPSAISHSSPLMIFPDNVPSTHVEHLDLRVSTVEAGSIARFPRSMSNVLELLPDAPAIYVVGYNRGRRLHAA